MKQALLTLLLVLCAANAPAQVTVEVVLSQKEFVPRESLVAGVRIRNVSGQTLKLGGTRDWVRFRFESEGNVYVRELEKPAAIDPFEIPNGESLMTHIDITPYFDLAQPGRYSIYAVLSIPQWQKEETSDKVPFEIMNATEKWSQRFGVPPAPGAPPGPGEVRQYSILQAGLGNEKRLYVRVANESGTKVIRVVLIGPFFELTTPPDLEIDRSSCLCVLHRSGRSSYAFSVFDPDGKLKVRQRHDYNEFTRSRPRLEKSEDGKVIVAGGVRKYMPDDVPVEIAVPAVTQSRDSK